MGLVTDFFTKTMWNQKNKQEFWASNVLKVEKEKCHEYVTLQ